MISVLSRASRAARLSLYVGAVLLSACTPGGAPERSEEGISPGEATGGVGAKETDTSSLGTLDATLQTTKGDIRLQLYAAKAPLAVASFVLLAQSGFYDDLAFHRVVDDFMVQGGCPLGTGTGGPGYRFEDEFHPDLNHAQPGTLSMFNLGPDTNGSQFFITLAAAPWLDGKHTVFGKAASPDDLAVVLVVEEGDHIIGVSIEGDTAPLLEAMRPRVEAWSRALSRP